MNHYCTPDLRTEQFSTSLESYRTPVARAGITQAKREVFRPQQAGGAIIVGFVAERPQAGFPQGSAVAHHDTTMSASGAVPVAVSLMAEDLAKIGVTVTAW